MVRRVRADRERQSMATHNRHDFHAFSALRSSDFQPATLGHNKGCVDEAFFFVQYASIAKLVGNIRQHATQNLIAAPMKIMAIVDRHGLPLSVSTHAANHHEVRLVQLCFDFYMIEAKPENLIGDRAYDSDPLDAELRKDGIEMIAPHRCNRSKPPTQDRRRLSRYMRRWLVERFFAWIQWQRRILVRWE